ncbi:hypothetical protein Tco_1022532 [Tanacetum coccineum]
MIRTTQRIQTTSQLKRHSEAANRYALVSAALISIKRADPDDMLSGNISSLSSCSRTPAPLAKPSGCVIEQQRPYGPLYSYLGQHTDVFFRLNIFITNGTTCTVEVNTSSIKVATCWKSLMKDPPRRNVDLNWKDFVPFEWLWFERVEEIINVSPHTLNGESPVVTNCAFPHVLIIRGSLTSVEHS